jgi:hypothetical protein
LFDDVGLRKSLDLDIFVFPDALARAEALMLDHGYKRVYPPRPLTPRQWQNYQRVSRNFGYYLPERQIHTELHWSIASTTLVSMNDAEDMLDRARPMAVAGAHLHALSDEDLPVFLVIHGSRHAFARLKWLVDYVSWVRATPDPDWEGLRARLEGLGLQRMLAQAALLAQELFSVPLAEPVQALVESEPQARHLAAHSLENILNPEYYGDIKGRFVRVRHIPYRMRFKKGLRYKWNTLLRTWDLPDDWIEFPLPDALFPLYWVLRPFIYLKRNYLSRRAGQDEDSPGS